MEQWKIVFSPFVAIQTLRTCYSTLASVRKTNNSISYKKNSKLKNIPNYERS